MAAEKPGTPTRYLVLKLTGASADGIWNIVNAATASSATAAIRAVVSKLAQADQAGTYVAVPARSWKPTKVAPKTTVQLELTEVKP